MGYKPIRDYGVIGDRNSAALVARDGSIDWCCFPRFDSPSVFAAILDDRQGGRLQIAPLEPFEARQAYLPYTNILTTSFITPGGEVTVTDFMPLTEGRRPGQCPHQIHRIVRCDRGRVKLFCDFQPRFDYAGGETLIHPTRYGLLAHGPQRQSLTFCGTVPLAVEGDKAYTEFTLKQGQEAIFVLSYGHTRTYPIRSYHTLEKLERTQNYWETIARGIDYQGLWREEVIRSFLVLHLLMYSPTGALVAAPTTSLPEEIGGERNWDYRYFWLRDAAFTLEILFRLGDRAEAHSFFSYLLDQCKVTEKTRIVYGIEPSSSLEERVLPHLEGYRGSRPVRIGNRAVEQIQMDVFGEVILSIATYHKYGGYVSREIWALVQEFAEVVCRNWRRKDRSIWEVRGARRHFVFSKLMCWVALDRAIRLARDLGYNEHTERWQAVAQTIRQEILTQGWSERKKSFVQAYGSEALDASNLIIPMVGFLPPYDLRVHSTIRATLEELGQGCLLRRYLTEETDDGLRGSEGAFVMLTFWLIGALIITGQLRKAREYFEEVLSYANHLGLYSEMIDPKTKEFLGNFPQALSHIGLIHTARNLSMLLGKEHY